MGNKLYEENSVQAIADAIRDKGGTTDAYTIEQMANAIETEIEQYGKTIVPKTGGWQFKSTYPYGFIILGKDDDVADTAQFVRMLYGYNFYCTLNTTQQCVDNPVNSDSNTEYSTYPVNSYPAQFPNGCTIKDINQFVLDYGLGEIAMHGVGAEKIWDSEKLTGDVLDTYYEAYTTGGGQKTKEEFKIAFMEKYASQDVRQGCTILLTKRKALQHIYNWWIHSIGTWGGAFDVVIDDINCGTSGAVNSTTQLVSRQLGFCGDGGLTQTQSTLQANPYDIYRDSSGLTPSRVETDLASAFNNRTCIELFHHYYLDGTQQKWDDFKTTLDTIQTWVNQNKIWVVTRKQFYDLGEFVEHPIVALSFSTKNPVYKVGKTFTASDFNMKAVLDNGTVVDCQPDRIIYLSSIHSEVIGTYTATLEYRGFVTTCQVVISNEVPATYLLENWSTSGVADDLQRNNVFPLDNTIYYEKDKHYRIQFHFKVETPSVSGGQHYYTFWAPADGGYVGWRESTEYTLNAIVGYTEGDITVELTANRNQSIGYLARIKQMLNITKGNWWVTNAYVYEYDPLKYLVKDFTASDAGTMSNNTMYGDLPASITYEAGKSYRLECHLACTLQAPYSNRKIEFYCCDQYNNKTTGHSWKDDSYPTGADVPYETDIVIEWTTNTSITIDKFIKFSGGLNTTIGNWTITNGCLYEIEAPEEEVSE